MHNKVYSANKVWKDAKARAYKLKNIKMIQATMLKVTGDVSCCTCKCMQALEALNFFARYMRGANF